MDRPLPQELRRFAGLHDLVYRADGEWSSACPQCGGGGGGRSDESDRFRLFAANNQHNARVWCRRCNHFEWAEIGNAAATPRMSAKSQEERLGLQRAEEIRLKDKIAKLQHDAYWRGYHDRMEDTQRELWREEGINNGLQDWFSLGYVAEKNFKSKGDPFASSALTIPYFSTGKNVVNMQYRLLKPPRGVGKYRFTYGLPQALFLTEPSRHLSGDVVIVEGAKKAIVTWAQIGEIFTVIGLPSKSPPKKLIDELELCGNIYLALDPDAYYSTRARNGKIIKPSVNRIAKMIEGRGRLVKLPAKADDFFTIYGGTREQFIHYLHGSRPI